MKRALRAFTIWLHLASFGILIGVLALWRAFNPRSVGSHWRGAVGVTRERVLEILALEQKDHQD